MYHHHRQYGIIIIIITMISIVVIVVIVVAVIIISPISPQPFFLSSLLAYPFRTAAILIIKSDFRMTLK